MARHSMAVERFLRSLYFRSMSRNPEEDALLGYAGSKDRTNFSSALVLFIETHDKELPMTWTLRDCDA